MANGHRLVIREKQFERELRALISDPVEADEFVEAAEWVLVNVPETGVLFAVGSPIWVLPMAPVAGKPVTLYYAFDDETLWLISIQAE
jgi:hypothetical protein